MEPTVVIGAAQDPEAGLRLGVGGIGGDDERLVEKDFFGFATGNIVLGWIFSEIPRVPLEASVVGGIEDHALCLYVPGIYRSRAKNPVEATT